MARSVIGALRVTLGLDSAEFETGIRRASKSTQQFTRASKDVKSASDQISSSLRGVGAALGITSVAAAGAAYLKLADQSKQLAAQLRLATAQFGNFGQAQQDVNRIAAETRNGLSETGTLYANFIRATKELGGQQWEAARATETFSKTLKISGAGQAEAASATLQFGQALASGVLRGDEFNSIMESSPRLARLLADSLGVPIGSLRKMAEEGELTADRLFRALTDRKFTDGIDAEFRQMPVTFDEAMGQIRNAAVTAFGGFDRGGQFSNAVTGFVTDGVNGFGDIGDAAERMGIQVRHAVDEMTAVFKPFIDVLQEVRSGLVWAQNLNQYKITPDHIAGFADSLTSVVRAPLAASSATANLFYGKNFGDSFNSFMDSTSIASRMKRSDAALDKKLTGSTLDRIMQGNPLADAPKVASIIKPTPANDTKGDKAAARAAEAARKKAQREAERAAQALQKFADDVAREGADYVSTQAELTGTIEARRDADINQLETERAIRERAIEADDQIDAAKKQQLIDLNNRNVQARKDLTNQRAQEDIDRRNLQIEQDRSALAVELMQLSADAARTARERRAVELRILDAQFEAERQALLIAAASKDLAEATRARERLAALPQIQAGARDQVIRQTQGPMEAYLDRLPRSADEAREALERVQVDGIDGIINGLADAAIGARSLGDVFKGVANQIVADLIRIQLQRALLGSGGGGGLLGGLLKIGGSALGIGGGLSGVNTAGLSGIETSLHAATVSNMGSFALPAFATGGSFKVGGSSSVGDKELVQFRANRGEIVDIRKPGNDNGGGGIAHIVPSPYFDVVVDKRAAGVAQPMAMQAATAGSTGAQVAIARQRSRIIP